MIQSLLGAAIVLALVIAFGGCGEDSTTAASSQSPTTRYAPTVVPGGLAPCSAIFVSDNEWAAQTAGDGSDPSRVWGDASLSDPWSGPLAIITTRSADLGYQHEYARPTRVNGRPAEVSPMPLFQGVDSAAWGHIVTMRRPSGAIVELALHGGSAKEAVAMAGKVDISRNRPSLPNDALGSKTAVISTSPPDSGVAFGFGRWSLGYKQTNGPEDPADPGFLTLDTGGQPARPNALELTALYSVTATATTVNGQPALDYAQFDAKKGPFGVVWETAEGQLIDVFGFGASREQIRAAAESLQPIDDAAWAKIEANNETCLDIPKG